MTASGPRRRAATSGKPLRSTNPAIADSPGGVGQGHRYLESSITDPPMSIQ